MQAQQGGLMGPENMRGLSSGYTEAMFPGGYQYASYDAAFPEVWFRAMMTQLGGNGQSVANERSIPEGFSGHSR